MCNTQFKCYSNCSVPTSYQINISKISTFILVFVSCLALSCTTNSCFAADSSSSTTDSDSDISNSYFDADSSSSTTDSDSGISTGIIVTAVGVLGIGAIITGILGYNNNNNNNNNGGVIKTYAYVLNQGDGGDVGTVSVIDTATNTLVSDSAGKPISIAVGEAPTAIATTPNGAYAYVLNQGDGGDVGTVSVIDTATNTLVSDSAGKPISITVGKGPTSIAITPNGAYAYVVNEGYSEDVGTVSVIDTATNTLVSDSAGKPISIAVGEAPTAIATTPNGAYAYVTNWYSNSVSVIDTWNNTVNNTLTEGYSCPMTIAIATTPNGAYAYVVNEEGDDEGVVGTVSVIDTATNTLVSDSAGKPISITVGKGPTSIAITPNGAYAYVTNWYSNSVSVIDTWNNTVNNTLTEGYSNPAAIAIATTSNGVYAYVVNEGDNTVSVIDTSNNTIKGSLITVGTPIGIAIATLKK